MLCTCSWVLLKWIVVFCIYHTAYRHLSVSVWCEAHSAVWQMQCSAAHRVQCVAHVAVMDGAFPIPPANTGASWSAPSGHTQLQTFSGCSHFYVQHWAYAIEDVTPCFVFYAQKSGWFESRLEIVKITNREFYGKEHSQICFKAESQVKPKAENVLRFYHFLQHHWLILLGSSDCQAVAKMALALRRDRGGLQHVLLLLVIQISKSWCCCCWIWLHTIA